MPPNSSEKLLKSSTSLINGLRLHADWVDPSGIVVSQFEVGQKQVHEAMFNFTTARHSQRLATDRLMIADKGLKAWLTKARLVVMLARGSKWSETLSRMGFSPKQARIPGRLDGRVSLARALVSFFARHPDCGVPFAEVTAVRGRAIYERAIQSHEMLELAKKDAMAAQQQCEEAESGLRSIGRVLISELKSRMRGSDPRWLDFGLAHNQARKGGLGRSPLRPKPMTFVARHQPRGHAAAA